ncbi:MAG: dethiobiotin synthase [Bacteroidetes bacterium]|nr:dethiobiotin synthase [Bacteroidota bacterium]
MNVFITGNGTSIGKTVVSAVLCEAWQADYWKPVQCGGLDSTDTMMVKKLISNKISRLHPESYRFTQPMSPHAAAESDGIEVNIRKIKLPETQNPLIIEGCGGLLVPLNKKNLVIDLVPAFEAETILVSRHYLGSINHTLLSCEALKRRKLPVKGIIFIGNNPSTEEIILHYSKFKFIGRLEEEKAINKQMVSRYAVLFS